jgi:hypothetical protein
MIERELVQVYRRSDGAYAVKAERAALAPSEMLIGRGLEAAEAEELVAELNGGDERG